MAYIGLIVYAAYKYVGKAVEPMATKADVAVIATNLVALKESVDKSATKESVDDLKELMLVRLTNLETNITTLIQTGFEEQKGNRTS